MADRVLGVLGGMGPLASAQFMLRLTLLTPAERDQDHIPAVLWSDPRAKILQESAHAVLAEMGIKGDPLLDLALALEKIALSDPYFVDRKLYPNVDFYSGIILKAMGLPISMFTVLFAVARTVGWISQWKEMIEDPLQRIGRPRQVYVGAPMRDFTPLSARG